MPKDCPKNEKLAQKQSFEVNYKIFNYQIFQFSNKRINSLSYIKEVFYNTAPLYNHALKQSNFDFCLPYEQPTAYCNALTRWNRQRDVIWFNPPYSFLRFPDKHFPPSHKLDNISQRRIMRIFQTRAIKSFQKKKKNTPTRSPPKDVIDTTKNSATADNARTAPLTVNA